MKAGVKFLFTTVAFAVSFTFSLGCQNEVEQLDSAAFKWKDTWDGIHLFIYGGGGLAGEIGKSLTYQQVTATAQLIDAALWLYSDTGVARALKEGNPEVLTFLYYDAIYAGEYQSGYGMYWMPKEDWDFVVSHPNMFAKNCKYSKEQNCWLRNPIWTDEWLMDISDFNPSDPEDKTHWVNFYAQITKERIERDGFIDGLFIDELMLPYTPYMPENLPHWDAWFIHLKRMAEHIRKIHRGRPIVFNGLQQNFLFYPRVKELLEFTDGALFECFVLCWAMGPYMGEYIWLRTLELALELEQKGKAQFLQAIWHKDEDPPASLRLLALSSYYLVKGHASFFFLNQIRREHLGPQYLPEWDVDLGSPLAPVESLSSLRNSTGCYIREYEKGFAVANPDERSPCFVSIPSGCRRAVPTGTYIVDSEGNMRCIESSCNVDFVPVEGELEVAPVSGEIILCDTM